MASKIKFTKQEKSWILYDWANSVFATNMMAAIFPIYFGSICAANGADNVVLWSYGTAVATFIVALLAPVLGSVGDYSGMKKKLFSVFLVLGVGCTFANAFVENYRMMLVGYVLSYIGFMGANLFYDSFLTDVTTSERMDRVSAWGYAMGYIGGSTIPFLISIAVLLLMDYSALSMKIVITLTSLWWAVFSIPILKNVRQIHCVERPDTGIVKTAFVNLGHTARDIVKVRGVLLFMLAYFFYIDGVNTVINISTSYGSKLGLDTTGMILALLVTQIVAVPFSILFARLADRVGSIRMIRIAICIYFLICAIGFFMGYNIEQNEGDPNALQLSQTLFWILAFCVGTVQGGIQALSRSYFGKLIPPSRSNEYFGFFDIFGKFAAVIGPVLVAAFTQLTGRNSIGVLSLMILFAMGWVILTVGGKHFRAAESDSAQAKTNS